MGRKEVLGTYRHQIFFLEPEKSKNNFGGQDTTYVKSNFTFASFDYLTARSDEDEVATRLQAYTHAEIKCRYRGDISEKWRVEFDGDTFNIEAILPDTHERHMIVKVVKIEG